FDQAVANLTGSPVDLLPYGVDHLYGESTSGTVEHHLGRRSHQVTSQLPILGSSGKEADRHDQLQRVRWGASSEKAVVEGVVLLPALQLALVASKVFPV